MLDYCVSRIYGPRFGRLALLPPILFFALTEKMEWVHYTGEQCSIFLSMAALAALCFSYERGFEPAAFAATGLFIGAMPFAKLQSVPLAASLLLVAALAAVVTKRTGRVAFLALGCLVVPAVVLSCAAIGGTFEDFWRSYIVSSISYILYDYPPLAFLTATDEFGPFFDLLTVCGIAGIACAFAARGRIVKPGAFGLLGAVLLFAGALYAIYSPRRTSLNYLTFAVFPVSAFAVAGLAAVPAVWGRVMGTVLVAACCLARAVPFRQDYPYLPSVYDYDVPEPLTALLEKHVRPGERMAIWGWRPKYYVYTRTVMVTRDAITKYQFEPDFNPERPYFRKRYLADFERSRPVAFLDTGVDSFGPDGGYES